MPMDPYSSDARGTIHALIDTAATLNISNSFHVWHGDWVAELPRRDNNRVGVFPAIAIPTVSKATFECPIDHLNALQTVLPQVTKIITIGWRIKEEHFLNLLSTHPRRKCSIIVV